jgi:hypothetical protein
MQAMLTVRHSVGETQTANSPLETICHLRDIEAEGYTTRINRILIETNPVLGDIDGGRLAVERNYNDQDPDLALHEFTIARATTRRGYEAWVLKVLIARAYSRE